MPNIETIAQRLLDHIASLTIESEKQLLHYKGAADGIRTLIQVLKEEEGKAESGSESNQPGSSPQS